MQSTEATREHARDILAFIELNPEIHYQGLFIANQKESGCGTTMCIAGTSNFLMNGKDTRINSSESVGRKALGLSVAESEVLFYDMSEERALAKLRKVAAGTPFNRYDFYKAANSGDNTLYFDDYAWEMYEGEQELDSES